MFEVPYPEVEPVRRRLPGQASPGDWTVARVGVEMIQLLETTVAGHAERIGVGYEPLYTVPFGLTASASYAILDPVTSADKHWTGYAVELEWFAPPELSDHLIARAELDSIQGRYASFSVSVTTASNVDLLMGKLLLTATSAPRVKLCTEEPATFSSRQNSFLKSVRTNPALPLGWMSKVFVELENRKLLRSEFKVSAAVPFGAGLSLESDATLTIRLGPMAKSTVEFLIRADRPHEVNLSKPWPLTITCVLAGKEEKIVVPIRVPDPDPCQLFYLLTEDCETFDGGVKTGDYGASSSLGNANNFMDPEDYRVQMIEKPNRMNEIADEFGAKWTHFWCATQRFAVDWARGLSSTGAWDSIAADLDNSLRMGCVRHEYAPHIHFDYEPCSALPPQPRLVYDAVTDGILPTDYYDPITNPRHVYHDWDGASRGISYVKKLGDLCDGDSKAGSLRKVTRYLARLQSQVRYPLIARTGGFDFGKEPDDQRISTAAYRLNGLPGNSDATFPVDAFPTSNGFYWCQENDRSSPVERLEDAKLVQLGVSLQTDFLDLEGVNAWFSRNLKRIEGAGVRALSVMTHAMFMRGEPDPFRSLTGGSFAAFGKHLEYVRQKHPEVRFATASEALIEFLDYYSPVLRAYVEPNLLKGSRAGLSEHQVRLLGRGIRVDANHPAKVSCALPPSYDASEVAAARVFADGILAGEARPQDDRVRPEVEVTLTKRPRSLRLVVALRGAHANAVDEDLGVANDLALLRVRPPEQGRFSLDVLKLLLNPVAGGADPLGRRLHPVGCFGVGISLFHAFSGKLGFQPCKLKLRWRSFPPDSGYVYAESRQQGSVHFIDVTDDCGNTIVQSEVTLTRDVSAREASG